MLRFLILFWVCATAMAISASGQTATVSGKVENEAGKPMAGVSVTILGERTGIATNDSGYFSISLRANRAVALVFSYAGYQTFQKNFFLNAGEAEQIVLMLLPGANTLDSVVVSTDRNRRTQAGLISLNPKLAALSPAPVSGVENLIKVIVGSNNELTSQYNVRGGSFDENLIYVNDFEVFRPYLIRNGQQEGLSFINPELVRQVDFYNGGFQARHGDKMSSVLDVQYKKPTRFGGSAYAGLLEQGVHVEGRGGRQKKFSYLAGLRNRNLSNLLSAQETKGNYVPASADLQVQLAWQLKPRWQVEVLTNLSSTRFELEPVESRQTTSVFTPLFSANLGLDINFEGREEAGYRTRMVGLSTLHTLPKGWKLKGMLSYFNNRETENINVLGRYLFGERSFDKSAPDFGLITNPLGAGEYLTYARNRLDVSALNATLRGSVERDNHYWQFGQSIEQTRIEDDLLEWEYQDSAGFSLPNRTGPLALYRSTRAQSGLNITRLTGFIQDNLTLKNNPAFTAQLGLRYNYNTLNGEMVLSPRAGFSFTPQRWKRDVIFKGSIGMYHQPPFYREMRRYDGTVNPNLKAQRSQQVTAGMDYTFLWGRKPVRWTTEAFYKNMQRIVPYDIDNVRLRYFGQNAAKAYAYGIETRLNGELVKNAESWLSIGLMRTMEDLDGDFYQNYFNRNGELITAETEDQVVVDSAQVNIGYLRRPTDRRLNLGLFFSDYLSTNQNFRVYVQLLYGTNLPYNIPGSVRYRNALEIPSYIRADIGFSYQLLPTDKSARRSHHPLRGLENMWLQFEVFNLLDRDNTISFLLIKDFSNSTFAIPNRLTPRLLNLKLIARW